MRTLTAWSRAAVWQVLHVAPVLEQSVHAFLRAQPGANVTGIDVKQHVRATCRWGTACTESPVVYGDVRRLDAWRDASVDLIVCNHVLEHVDDLYAALRELHRVLRPEGHLLLTVPFASHRAPTVVWNGSVTQALRDRRRDRRHREDFHLFGNDVADLLQRRGFHHVQIIADAAHMVPHATPICPKPVPHLRGDVLFDATTNGRLGGGIGRP